MEPGIYELTNAQYHAAPGISKSGLDLIARSPAHYRASLDEPRIETPAMLAGSVIHTAILEPHKLDAEYAVQPPFDRRTTVGKQGYAEWLAANAGRTAIPADLYDTARRVAEAVRSNPACAFLLGEGVAEQSIFATDPETGVLVKCRPDWQSTVNGLRINCDVKSTEDARPGGFGRSAVNYHYPEQAAFYSDVCQWAGLPPPDAWFFLAVEKSAPFGVVVYEPDEAFLEYGRERYRRALNIYAQCLATDTWPGYAQEVQSLTLPAWA